MGIFGSLFEKENIENLSPDDFKMRLEEEKDAALIDVRTQAEHSQMKIPNSKLIEVQSAFFKDKLEKLDKKKAYFLYCQTGSRSYYAAKSMKRMGFEKVYNLSTGIAGWKGPVE